MHERKVVMKMYPFSVQKNAHSIEFFHNRIANILYDVEGGQLEMSSDQYNRLRDFFDGELQELYEAMFQSRDGRVVYLTGRQIGLAKKVIVWASEQRAASLIANGKLEFLKYC